MERPEISTMTDHDMLVELLTEKRKAEKRRIIYWIIIGIIIIVCISMYNLYMPKALAIMAHYKEVLDETEELVYDMKENLGSIDWEQIKKIQEMISQFEKVYDAVDWDNLIDKLETLQKAMNTIDWNSLIDKLETLQKALNSLSGLTGLLGN